jgi:hypothetical protein
VRNAKRPNPTHHRKIARALRRALGINYQLALEYVRSAAREGVLPAVLDAAGCNLAVRQLAAAIRMADKVGKPVIEDPNRAEAKDNFEPLVKPVESEHALEMETPMGKLDPELAAARMRDHGAEPLVPYPGADRPWLCLHIACGRQVTPRYSSVVLKLQGPCYNCGQKKSSRAAAIKRRLNPDSAAAAMRDRGAEPLEPYPGTNVPWLCRCLTCNEEITPHYSSVVYNGTGPCLHCAGQTPNSEVEAKAEMMSKGLAPLVPYPGLNKPWQSRCATCAREVAPTLSNVRKTRGCKYCSKRATDPDSAHDAMLQAGFKPVVPFPAGGVKAPWRSIHLACGNEVAPTLDKINSGAQPCRHCAEYGYNLAIPGFAYLIVHPKLSAAKIGIYNHGSNRLVDHQRRGWVLERKILLPGRDAQAVEEAVLRKWRSTLRLSIALTPEEMPQGGWTETVRLNERPLRLLLLDLQAALDGLADQGA